jgi:hypothetical protein
MDAHVRKYIHSNLGYRIAILPDGKTARELEKLIKNGAWPQGKPLLNPSGKKEAADSGAERPRESGT